MIVTDPCFLAETIYDFIFTDYIGLFALRDSQHFYLNKVSGLREPLQGSLIMLLTMHSTHDNYTVVQCKIRVLDSFGTEPICESVDHHISQYHMSQYQYHISL